MKLVNSQWEGREDRFTPYFAFPHSKVRKSTRLLCIVADHFQTHYLFKSVLTKNIAVRCGGLATASRGRAATLCSYYSCQPEDNEHWTSERLFNKIPVPRTGEEINRIRPLCNNASADEHTFMINFGTLTIIQLSVLCDSQFN